MKLASFTHANETRIGVIVGELIVDLSKAVPELPTTMRSFLHAGDEAMQRARDAQMDADHALPVVDVELEAPIPNPGKILAIGLNYADHIEETGAATPKVQMWFNKQITATNRPTGPIAMPSVSDKLDYEGELVFVVGKWGRHVTKERAPEMIAGFCCGNDVSVRDWQGASPTMQIGKSFDTHAPFGPWIVTPDEIGDAHDLSIRTYVNGEIRQDSNTKHLVFNCYDQIAHLTKAFSLEPGDVIYTGTSSGVGMAHKPPKWLKIGDTVRVEIENIGYIENSVVEEDPTTRIS